MNGLPHYVYNRYIEGHVGNITVPGLDAYPDFVSMGLLVTATLLVSVGVNVRIRHVTKRRQRVFDSAKL